MNPSAAGQPRSTDAKLICQLIRQGSASVGEQVLGPTASYCTAATASGLHDTNFTCWSNSLPHLMSGVQSFAMSPVEFPKECQPGCQVQSFAFAPRECLDLLHSSARSSSEFPKGCQPGFSGKRASRGDCSERRPCSLLLPVAGRSWKSRPMFAGKWRGDQWQGASRSRQKQPIRIGDALCYKLNVSIHTVAGWKEGPPRRLARSAMVLKR